MNASGNALPEVIAQLDLAKNVTLFGGELTLEMRSTAAV